jgi:hypothetical protein
MIRRIHAFRPVVRQHIMMECVVEQNHLPYGQESKRERRRIQDATIPFRETSPMI